MTAETTLQKATAAAMAEVKRQFGGQQIPGTPDERFWAATSDDDPMQSLDISLIVRVVVGAMRDPPEKILDEMQSYALCAGYIPEGWNAAIDAILAEHPNDRPANAV